MGRPRKYSDEQIQQILSDFDAYIDSESIPIAKEFASRNKLEYHDLFNYEEFNSLAKRCSQKKEAGLERAMLNNDVNVTGAIFSLKQLGWRDKHEMEHTGSVVINFDGDDSKL